MLGPPGADGFGATGGGLGVRLLTTGCVLLVVAPSVTESPKDLILCLLIALAVEVLGFGFCTLSCYGLL